MKVSELRDRIEKLKMASAIEEEALISYRNRNNIGICIGEIEARSMVKACNLVLAFLDDLVYEQEVIND